MRSTGVGAPKQTCLHREPAEVDPWYFQVDSVSTTLICDTIHNLNVKGETWQANVTNILNGPTEGLFKGNTLID
jgi:hypothetical protein